MQREWQLEELTQDDYEAAMRLWNASPGVNANETAEEFARILARNPGMSFCVRAGGQLIGAVFCGHDGHRGFLYHLAVEPAYRQQGIARLLVDRCLARLAEEGIRRVSIHLFTDNDGGAAFWRQTGWRARPNVLVMSKDL
ncbi:MAG TPA: GNAT family N-acetyltransferase [Pirellulaceae bacterium]|nr:GNAT family N-acetyltransferase [Pirellulaceae bacterium]